MLWARILANVIVVIHVAYVSFVVFGLLAILIGLVLRWEWVRNFWFRTIHLAMIGIVVLESLAGIACPLTTWEKSLRTLGGQKSIEGDFIAAWTHRLIMFRLEPWVFILFGAAVLLAFVLGPPRRRRLAVRPETSAE